ncbi:MAG: hypothetical protein OEW75_07680 [Cyclobacteriaceae bacterium]|nr:hypothetical protein [Cyclobacteriaceae bacterium]
MNRTILTLLFWIIAYTSFSQNKVCINDEEKELYNLIMDYRMEKGLESIPLSASLTFVAQTHSEDLFKNFNLTDSENCNAHSWSDNGEWTSCCYTADHKQAGCMWSKPRELAGYNSEGFEIAYYFSSGAKASQSLKGWKASEAHNELLTNQGIWGDMKWEAIGIGIHENYATVWFGVLKDEKGEPQGCK